MKYYAGLFYLFCFVVAAVTVLSATAQEETELAVYSFDSRCDSNAEVYIAGIGCIAPKLRFTRTISVGENVDAVKASSLLGGIDPIRIDDPWAAAGQPVIVQFTLENIGDQFDYPFNQIALLPDNYALVLSVDKDIGVFTAEGKFIDIWGMMNAFQKFVFIAQTSWGTGKEAISKQLAGKQCGYVDVRAYLPDSVVKSADERAGFPLDITMWDCLRIVDLPFFAKELRGYCQGSLTGQCLSAINKDFAEQVTSTVTVALSSFESSNIEKGECARAWDVSGALGKIGLAIRGKANLVVCGIGDSGLEPGDSVSFDFVALVPSDTPVIPPRAIGQTAEGDLEQGYTMSAQCENSRYASACHSIYAAVYPLATETFFTWIGDGLTSSFKVGGCLLSGWLAEGTAKQCLSTRGAGAETVGEPIWEGAGIFYIVGPTLKGSITLILLTALLGGGVLGLALGKRRS